MSLLPSTVKKCYTPNFNKIKGAKEGKLYEIISLLTLAKRGYQLSKHENPKFREFSVGREVGIGKDRKLDDVVFSYVDEENTKNLIFLQIKHYQYYNLINSGVLSTKADRAKDVAAKSKNSATRIEDVRYGNMCKDFNLQKYFISYLSIRDELKNTNTKELIDGEIKYVVLLTNVGLDNKELEGKGFILKKAPDDIVNLFTLSSETQHSNHCYQLGDVSVCLRKILKKSSDLDRLARSLAQYVVCEDYRKNRIMGIRETLIKYYHVALEREVIQKSTLKQVENGQYFRKAQFREDFLDCNETASNLYPLRIALFEAIRELDETNEDANPDELKRILKEAEWKIVYNFKKSIETDFPCEWIQVGDEDINDFLRCFVFIVNQPRVSELELLYQRSIQDAVVENISLKQLEDQINATGPEFRDCVENLFGLDIKPHNDEKWISRNQIEDFMKEKQQLLRIIFVVSAMTLMYINEIMQYGEFNDLGKIKENVKNFLTCDSKILCVNTSVTLLSSIKISQLFSTEKIYPISVSLNILNYTENTDCVLKAFELESISLLTIECRHVFKDNDINFLYELVNIAKINSNKKMILIMQQENWNIFTKHFKIDFQDEEICVIENDSIDLKYFEPKENPLAKKVLVFQEQKEKVSLSDITGINSWNSYVDNLSEETSEEGIIDGMTLVDILSNGEIEVGSKPPGTSSLEGAYAQMYEEIDVDNLVHKLTSQRHSNDTNDMYIISGISGSGKQDKTEKVIQYLALNNNKEIIQDQLGDIGSEGKIQIVDDQFKDKDFQRLCHRHKKKRIFWISVKCENGVMKLILQETYNPKFYLKRKFKNVIIKKDLKEQLIKDDLFETFIFHCVEDKHQLYKSMNLNEREIKQFEENCKIKIFSLKSDAETAFKEFSKQNQTVHLIEFEEKMLVWCNSHGSVESLHRYIDYERCETSLVEEDNLIRKIKDRKVVILADDPGMGKTTTLIKLYETEIQSSSIIKSHWVIRIQLRDNLKYVRDLEIKKDRIDIASVVEFLSKIDLKLNNQLAKNLMANALDKSKHFPKSLLFAFDGFDEILDEEDRDRIILLLKLIKKETTAKLWITTRLHFKKYLEKELSTIAVEFVPMDDQQKYDYIKTYLQHRSYLILNDKIFNGIFSSSNYCDEIKSIHAYTSEFLNNMKKTFEGNISRFIGTPLQFNLMLEGSSRHLKNWIRNDGDKIPCFNYLGHDINEIYENFIDRKYHVYFEKLGIPEGIQRRQEKINLDQYHKDFAKFRILESKQAKSLDEFSDKILLAGIIKSDDRDFQFIHKTFEEFFAAKVVIHWIEKVANKFQSTYKQMYLLNVILTKYDYQLIRAFMNPQLQRMTKQARHDSRLKHYGNIAAAMFNKKFLIDEYGETPLHVAVEEGNKAIACFLLNSLRGQPDVLREFLLTSVVLDKCCINIPGTALHLACTIDDVETVRILLDAAAGISEDTLQEFLKCSNAFGENALYVAAEDSQNVEIFKELFNRANNKLDLILTQKSALCVACLNEKKEIVDFLLQVFNHEVCVKNDSLKKLLLHNDEKRNALCYARSTSMVERLTWAAKSMKDNNETLKKLLLNKEGELPLNVAVYFGKSDVVEKLVIVAKEIDDDNHTLKQLLFIGRSGESPLHVAARKGRGDIIIKLLLETVSSLGIDILEKLITDVGFVGQNAIQFMFNHGHEKIFADTFKILEEEIYSNIRKKIKEMSDNVPLEIRLYWDKKELITAIKDGNIKEVKDILSNAKNSNYNPNERLRNLLLANDDLGRSKLCMACEAGNSEIMKQLLSYAKEIDDDNYTLKQLLLKERYGESVLHVAARWGYFDITKMLLETAFGLDNGDNNHTLIQLLLKKRDGESALHVAARWGRFDITKLLLETASGLGIEIWEELIFAVNEKGKNALQLMVENGHEAIFVDSFNMLKNKGPITWEK